MREYWSLFRSLLLAASIVLAALFIVVVGAPASAEDTYEYGVCPDGNQACSLFHPGSVMTSFCLFRDCFEMSYADEGRVVAADELGFFPKTWFAWNSGTLTPGAGISCNLAKSGNKTRIEIPAGQSKCSADLTTLEHLYHWHIVSNPTTGCLAWLECREY